MPKIKTPKGIYHYKSVPLYLGVKKIDREIAKENLFLLQTIANRNGIDLIFGYGTALGAKREHNFIEHDEDIDLLLNNSQRLNLLSSLFELRENGFEVARWDDRGLMSIIRNGEYIDIYLFHENEEIKYTYSCCGTILPKRYIEDVTYTDFLGGKFLIPKDWEEMLIFLYGNNWHTPIPYTDFKVSKLDKLKFKVKQNIKLATPNFIKNYFLMKNEKRLKALYYKRLNRFFNESINRQTNFNDTSN